MPNSDSSHRILVVNSGSSSLKFTLYATATEERLANGLVERIGTANANFVFRKGDSPKSERGVKADNHDDAIRIAMKELVDTGVLASLSEVKAIGHRVLHGGEIYDHSVLVDAGVLKNLDDLTPLGPLHMPANVGGIRACGEIFPGVPNVAVFDTAFHQSMPKSAFLYAIPLKYYNDFKYRKYGFHGTSHMYVTNATAKYLGKKPEDVNLITCHLGNGSSIAAIKNGKVLDTSMGLTPLAGLVMGSRSGDVDGALILELMRKGMDADAIDKLLNKQSGLLGVGGIDSGDMRDIVNSAKSGVDTAVNALAMWTHRLTFYIGGYFALLGGKVDAVVFTGGIGENSVDARASLADGLAGIGCCLDMDANKGRGPCTISKPDSKVKAVIMPTDEELMIERETLSVISK